MKYFVQVKLNSKIEGVEVLRDTNLIVRVRTKPVENQANIRVIEILSEHLKVPKSKIAFVSGQKSRKKVFEIE